MQALGNDFIIIDARGLKIEGLEVLSKRLCDRRFGIGADQLLLLENGQSAPFRMRIFNPDGSEVEMCGNGIRCLAKHIWERGLSDSETLEVETLAGIIKPRRAGNLIEVDMGKPIFEAERIPALLPSPVKDYPIEIEGKVFKITSLSMGNPHVVMFVDNLNEFPVSYYGHLLERHEAFPNRTNVEFVEVINQKEIRMRVWERGAGITLACGTGASAAAVASVVKGLTERKVLVHLDGGDLLIEWAQNGHVYMTGPAVEVFEGKIKID